MANDILFSVLNQNGEQALVAGQMNQLTVKVTNNTTAAIQLKGGTAVPEGQARTGPSSLYFSFGDLLTAAALKAIGIAASGWTPHYFDDPVLGGWAAAADANGTLAAGASQTFVITGVQAPASPRPGQFTIDYYNLGALTDSTGIDLPVRRAPSGHTAPDLVAAWVESNKVIITTDPANPVKNALTITVTNGSRTTPLVPPGTPWGADPPVFQVGFVCSNPPGYGALTTNESAAAIGLDQGEIYADVWNPEPNRQAVPPYWTLAPQQIEVLGVGDAASVQFTLSNIVTALQPGITVLYLQYANLPGYDDGYVLPPLTIEKRLPASIANFSASQRVVDLSGGPCNITLSWQVDHAELVTLSDVGVVNRSPTPTTFADSHVVTVRERTTYILQASATQAGGDGPSSAIEVLPLPEYLQNNTVPVTGNGGYQRDTGDERRRVGCSVGGSISFSGGNASCNLSLSGTGYVDYLDPDGKWDEGNTYDVPGQSAARAGVWSLGGSVVTLVSPNGNLQFQFEVWNGQPHLRLLTPIFNVDGYMMPTY
jgi:hypothetical protein